MNRNKKTVVSDKNRQNGFSILEVIISISILSIGILAAAHMQTVAVRGTALASRLTVDTVAAQDIIEEVSAARYSNNAFIDTDGDGIGDAGLTNDGEDDDLDEEGNSADVFIDNQDENYKLSLNIADNIPETNTKTIRIIVETPSPGGSKKTTYDFVKSQLTRP